MSFPSVIPLLEKLKLTPETATEEQREAAIYKAIQIDLPLGFAAMMRLINEVKEAGRRAILELNPNSEEGKQFARLFADVPRRIFEKMHGVHLGFANCCKDVGGLLPEDAHITTLEQILGQATPDC